MIKLLLEVIFYFVEDKFFFHCIQYTKPSRYRRVNLNIKAKLLRIAPETSFDVGFTLPYPSSRSKEYCNAFLLLGIVRSLIANMWNKFTMFIFLKEFNKIRLNPSTRYQSNKLDPIPLSIYLHFFGINKIL